MQRNVFYGNSSWGSGSSSISTIDIKVDSAFSLNMKFSKGVQKNVHSSFGQEGPPKLAAKRIKKLQIKTCSTVSLFTWITCDKQSKFKNPDVHLEKMTIWLWEWLQVAIQV